MSRADQPQIFVDEFGDLVDFVVEHEYEGLLTPGSISDGTYEVISSNLVPHYNFNGNKDVVVVRGPSGVRYAWNDQTWQGVGLKGPRPVFYDDPRVVRQPVDPSVPTDPGEPMMPVDPPGGPGIPGGPNVIPEASSIIVWSMLLLISIHCCFFNKRPARKL